MGRASDFWASLIVQLVKNPPALQETPVQFLGQEDPLEKGKATHSSILAWRISHKELDTNEWLSLSLSLNLQSVSEVRNLGS